MKKVALCLLLAFGLSGCESSTRVAQPAPPSVSAPSPLSPAPIPTSPTSPTPGPASPSPTPTTPVKRFGAQRAPGDPAPALALKFGFIGCNRLPVKEAEDQKDAAKHLTADCLHLAQTATDLQALGAQFLVMGGDVVMNEEKDSTTLKKQLDAWSKFWDGLSATLPLYVTPGNHEMVYSDSQGEFPNPPSGDQYRAWLAEHPEVNKGITPGPTPQSTYPGASADGLVDDQSQMSFYYDVPTPLLRDPRFPQARAIRIIALNTDTLTNLPETPSPYFGTGRAPWNWVASVVADAQADESVGGVIVMAHRPLTQVGTEDFSMDALTGQKLYQILSAGLYSPSNPTGKVRFFLCAHAHMYDTGQLTGPPTAIVKQNSANDLLGLHEIVAGCCGSPLESQWAATPTWGPGLPDLGIPYTDSKGKKSLQPYFGFQLVTVAVDGGIEVYNYGRLINPPYDKKTYYKGKADPAKVLSSVVVYP